MELNGCTGDPTEEEMHSHPRSHSPIKSGVGSCRYRNRRLVVVAVVEAGGTSFHGMFLLQLLPLLLDDGQFLDLVVTTWWWCDPIGKTIGLMSYHLVVTLYTLHDGTYDLKHRSTYMTPSYNVTFSLGSYW